MRHVQQNIFLDKDEGGKCSMFRQAEGFVKKQKTKKPKLSCSPSKCCWQISPHFSLIRETFSKSKAAAWSPKGGESLSSASVNDFGLDLSLTEMLSCGLAN